MPPFTSHPPNRVLSIGLRLWLLAALSLSWLGQATHPAQAVSTTVVISQVQTDGGVANDEFIEIHNLGSAPVNLQGYKLVYRSAAGTSDVTLATLGNVSLPAGGYYLAARSDYDGPVSADSTYNGGSIAKDGGGVALRNPSAVTVDSVGWGTAINAFIEGTRASAPATSGSLARKNNGCTDTDNNSADFELLTTAAPRNRSTPVNICGAPAPTNPTGLGAASPATVAPGGATLLTVSVTPGANPPSTGLNVIADLSSIGLSAAQAFYNDATHGDVTASDNIFSYQAQIDVATSLGARSLPVTISDAQARTSSAAIALAIAEPALVVISQVYGGGGNTGATYTHDFVELYNRGTTAVSLTGWTVQYASAGGSSWAKTSLTGVIQPGKYYLVQEAQGAGGTTALPTPDATGALAMSGTNGKVALVNSTTLLSGACPTGGSIIDFVGFGSATCYEGSAATPALSNTTAALRKSDGAQDTDQNGNDFTVGAPNPRNSQFGVDLAPYVLSVTPAGEAGNVAVDANLTINFSEPVNVTGSWYNIVCTVSGAHPAVVSGGPTIYTLNPNANFTSGETCTVTIVAAQVSDQDTPIDLMPADYSWNFTIIGGSGGPCTSSYTQIYTVQGSGQASGMVNTSRTIQGQVTADWQETGEMEGFYLQAATGDGNPATSDGIFIYDPGVTKQVAVNDVVRVTGTVKEYNGQTEIASVTSIVTCSTGSPAIAPTTVNMPESFDGELERYEGMLVSIPQTLTINQNYFLGMFGQMTLSVDSDGSGTAFNALMYYPTNGNFASNTAANNALRNLILDDAKAGWFPNPTPYLNPATHTNRIGDSVTGLTGILDQGAINASTPAAIDYRLHPTTAPVFTYQASRPTAPALPALPNPPIEAAGDLKVATFNVLNYFNGNGSGGGFPTSRGADTLAEFTRQRAKIISALQVINADVVGLMEIENDGTGPASAIQDLVNGLNTAMGAGTYDFVREPAPGTDAIKVGLIYKPAVVTPSGAAQNYQVNAGGYSPLFSRPPLIQTFTLVKNNEKFSVIVNHFKSRRCDDATGLDLDQGDLQGCYNAKRTAQATEMLNLVNSIAATSGDPDVLVIGDLNAYAQEAPLNKLKGVAGRGLNSAPGLNRPLEVNAGALNDLTAALAPAERYSFVFDGWLGQLDYILATDVLRTQAVAADIWHINAGEPNAIDYNLEDKYPDNYSPDPYRASDHDPVVVMFQINSPTAVTVTDLSADTVAQGIQLTWRLENAAGGLGFNLYRSAADGEKIRLNAEIIPIINPSMPSLEAYAFIDSDTLIPGQRYDYWLEWVTTSGSVWQTPMQITAGYRMFLPTIRK